MYFPLNKFHFEFVLMTESECKSRFENENNENTKHIFYLFINLNTSRNTKHIVKNKIEPKKADYDL